MRNLRVWVSYFGAYIKRCQWTYERWDGTKVQCTLRAEHTPIVPWPHHAPSAEVIKPWKRTAYPKEK